MNEIEKPSLYLDRLVRVTIGGDLAVSTEAPIFPAPPPSVIPNFIAAPLTGPAPLVVTFTDTTTGGVEQVWSWIFGDGGTSTVQNPTYTYAAQGIYSVQLTVTDSGTPYQVTKTNYIVVLAPTNYELREGGGRELREDGSFELRE